MSTRNCTLWRLSTKVPNPPFAFVMPAGVSWGQYLRFSAAAMMAMMAGAQSVHYYYKPLQDLDVYIEQELAKSERDWLGTRSGF